MTVLSKTPPIVIICATVILVAVIGGVVVLAYVGKDSNTITETVKILLGAIGSLAGTGAFIYAGAAARNAHTTVLQTNGVLDARIKSGVKAAISEINTSNSTPSVLTATTVAPPVVTITNPPAGSVPTNG